jgi:hypothetical protein
MPKHPMGAIVYPMIVIFLICHFNRNMWFCTLINGSGFRIDDGQIIYLEKACPVQKGHRQITLGNSKEFI